MNSKLKSNYFLKFILLAASVYFVIILPVFHINGSIWNTWDYRVNSIIYKNIVSKNNGPARSGDIVYVPITDETYQYFGKHILDRHDLAKLNKVLSEYDVESVAYDVIFARASAADADTSFVESLKTLPVYLPAGFAFSDTALPFQWKSGSAYQKLKSHYLKGIESQGEGRPYYGKSALMQLDQFSDAAAGTGHISSIPDKDGVFRHTAVVIRVDDKYFPTLSLAIFLDHIDVSLADLKVKWGESITIPASKSAYLENDIKIPIDKQGRAFVPFPQTWGKDFERMPVHQLLTLAQDENMQGNLLDYFEGKFVFVGDLSIGTSDLGSTPLEEGVPLIVVHTAFLNALLTNKFYSYLDESTSIALLLMLSLVLVLSSLLKNNIWFYLCAFLELVFIVSIIVVGARNHLFVPAVTIYIDITILLIVLLIANQVLSYQDRAVIKGVFSHYLPKTIIDQLLSHPEKIVLGGEIKQLTVLFSDIEGFTEFAESMAPDKLVAFLNEYLTEMTDIILRNGGIIDKYQGDAIMAEFGAPLDNDIHPQQAVRAALEMQSRLVVLREAWAERGLPEINSRIGINTGSMVIGNMGSNQVFDYTVIGDAVNLSARLESANKYYGTKLLISEFTLTLLPDGVFNSRLLDFVKVKGKNKPVKVYDIYGYADDELVDAERDYYQSYQKGIDAYLQRKFTEAGEYFNRALKQRNNDKATMELLSRIEKIEQQGIEQHWDGAFALDEK